MKKIKKNHRNLKEKKKNGHKKGDKKSQNTRVDIEKVLW
jgi:hypothetical protein